MGEKWNDRISIGVFIVVIFCQMISPFVPFLQKVLESNAGVSILLITIFIRVMQISKISRITTFPTIYDAFRELFKTKKHFKTVKIFAYSATNYINAIKNSGITIDHLYLLLKQASDKQAWFSLDPDKIRDYKTELAGVRIELERLVKEKKVKHLCIKYYDFESYSHFGIFDNYSVSGLLIPQTNDSESTVKISEVQLLGKSVDFGSASQIISSNLDFFDTLYSDGSCEVSGLEDRNK